MRLRDRPRRLLSWAGRVQIYPTITRRIEVWLQASKAMACNPLCTLRGAGHDNCAGAKGGLGRAWDRHTSKDGEDRLMDSLDLASVQDVAREEGYDEEDDQDGQGP